MTQSIPHFCPRCGTATVPNQRFCATCRLDLAPWLAQQEPQSFSQPGYQPSQPSFQSPSGQPSQPSVQQQSGPASQPGLQQTRGPVSQPGFQSWDQAPTQHFQQPAPVYNGYTAPPSAPVQPSPRSNKGRLRLVVILLLALLLLGGGGYLAFYYLGVVNSTQPTITATTLNSTVTYAGVTMTILKTEQAQRFIDDSASASDGMLRVDLQAQNKTAVPVNLDYTTIAELVMSAGKTLKPTYVKANVGVAPGGTQAGIVDFAVPTGTNINQLILRLGAANEAQIDIPLTKGANLTQYAPQTINLNGTFVYQGLNWSLVNAITQLSIDGKQASKGMHYVTLTLSVNNTLSQTAIPGSPYDYMRLKVGSTTATPVNTTLPVSFNAGVNGKTGDATFLVPQNVAVLTLTLLAQPQGGFNQVTQDFHLS